VAHAHDDVAHAHERVAGHGFLLVFSVTDRKSYDAVHKLYTKILRLKERESYPVLLIGNKIDLLRQRVVTTEQGRQLATELNVRAASAADRRQHRSVRVAHRTQVHVGAPAQLSVFATRVIVAAVPWLGDGVHLPACSCPTWRRRRATTRTSTSASIRSCASADCSRTTTTRRKSTTNVRALAQRHSETARVCRHGVERGAETKEVRRHVSAALLPDTGFSSSLCIRVTSFRKPHISRLP